MPLVFTSVCLCVCVCVLAFVMPLCACMCVSMSTVRSGYWRQANEGKALYFIEKELAKFPSAKMAALQRKTTQD